MNKITLKKRSFILITLFLILANSFTAFATPPATTPPSQPATQPAFTPLTDELWSAKNLDEKISYCNTNRTQDSQCQKLWGEITDPAKRAQYCKDNKGADSNCRSIYNEIGQCYYEDPTIARWDTIRVDCSIDPSKEGNKREACNKERNDAITVCQDAYPDAPRLYCAEQITCNANNNVEVRSLNASQQGIPYSSEFFNINDQTKGLVSPNQKTFDTNANGGPIIGTVNRVIDLMVKLIATFSLLVFIFGAILLITANGDDNQLQRGKGTIKYAIIGIIFVMLSYTIVILVQSLLF